MAECRVLSAECISENEMAGRRNPWQSSPFQCFLSKAGGTGVSTCTLERPCSAGATPAYRLPRHPGLGMPEGQSGRKLNSIIDARPEGKGQRIRG
jgi:hypothetical protein